MAKPGPPPKPGAIRRLEGDLSNRPAKAPEIEVAEAPVELAPPDVLDEVGKAEWMRMYPALRQLGLMGVTDLSAFTIYCAVFARCINAEAKVQKGPELVKTPNGHVQASPYFSIMRQHAELARMYLSEFGMTPSARARLVGFQAPRLPTFDDDAPAEEEFEAGHFTGLIGKNTRPS